MSIKNFVEPLILMGSRALCAKSGKKRGDEGVRGCEEVVGASTLAIKIKKTPAKNRGAVCTDWHNVEYSLYIYNNI